jgi:glycosyltransferase involved in cell wall biosynthesis
VSRPGRYSIAFLLTSFELGGTERQMVELIRRLDRSRFDVHVACFHLRGPLASLVTDEVASVETFPLTGFARPGTARSAVAFAAWCRRIGARIVHTCELYANIFGLPAAMLAGVDVRIGNRREILTPDKTRGHLLCQRLAYKAAHAVVANSAAAAAQLHREGVPTRKIRTIANGVDCDTFTPAVRDRSRPRRRVITVANLRREKGHDTLIAAIPQVIERRPDTEFVFVGDGPLRQELQDAVAERGLGSQVTFLGERRDVAALLAQSDVFVLPSRSEACPNGILEAMAAGLPTVACRVGGIPELVVANSTGILVEPDQPEALATALLDVLEQPERARALGAAARVRAERHFSFDRMVGAFEELYLRELAATAVTARAGRLAASGS